MLFSCPPSELVSYILETLSFSGQHGLSLTDLWSMVTRYLQSRGNSQGTTKENDAIDSFQQQCIWQWLFFSSEEENSWSVYAELNGVTLTIHPSYNEFLANAGDERSIHIKPTPDTQWKYLTGLAPLKKLKMQLGEKPFELLCVIAKHGSAGILSPDLVKEANQDPRSLPSRFKKLEEMNLIVKTSVYNEQAHQHTNHLVHIKFAEKTNTSSNDLNTSRRSHVLKQMIVESAKNAPNQLRGFYDLKVELNMSSKVTGSKFFGAMVESLHKQGYIEKVMVKDPKSNQSTYSIRFLKDLPKDFNSGRDYVQLFFGINTESNEGGETPSTMSDDGGEVVPVINPFFHPVNQIHQAILDRKTGVTSKEVLRYLVGVSGFRPWMRLLDNLASYVVNDTHLLPLKQYPDYYDDISIVRSFDFEGKYKVYRYYIKYIQHAEIPIKPHKAKRPNPGKTLSQSLSELTKSLYVPLSKVANGPFMRVKKLSDVEIAKKRIKAPPKRNAKKQRTAEPTVASSDDGMGIDILPPASDSPLHSGVKEENANNGGLISLESIKPILPEIEETKKVKRVRKSATVGSLKGQKRRTELLAIIRDFGGVTYTTARLCRFLDQRIGSSSATDMKTLARDICILTASKDLEIRDVSFIKSGKTTSRKILILTDPKYRPTEAKIEEAKEQCVSDIGDRPLPMEVRVIEGEVSLYLSKSKKKRKKSGKDRLGSLKAPKATATRARNRKVKVKEENSATGVTDNANDSQLPIHVSKKFRRKTQPKKRSEPKNVSGEQRIRTIYKFDKADATVLFRAIVIMKALCRKVINYDEIASLFDGMDTKSIKQKWSVVRKSVGGLQAVSKGIEAFERMVLKGIEEELVSSEDLENIKLPFFLDLWKDFDGTMLENDVDRTPLFASVGDNLKEYTKIEVNDVGPVDLLERLEDNSMRQKEEMLSSSPFFLNHVSYEVVPKLHDDLRSTLKAIFSTREENFSAYRVKKILAAFGDLATHEASSALIKDKEMIYYGIDDADSKFMLTDKVYNSLNMKIAPKIFNQAAKFKEQMVTLSNAKKGLILSQNVSSGDMASLLHLVSDQNVHLVHVDKAYNFSGYESRLIDKEKLSCDIVVIGEKLAYLEEQKSVPVPTGKACSHIWLDLNGNINQEIWIKIISAVLYHIHFRPGIPYASVYGKLYTILGVRDFRCVVEWLVQSGCIIQGQHTGLWTTSEWYVVLGY